MQLHLILAACLLMSVWTSDAKTLFKKHNKRTENITCPEGRTKCPSNNECILSSFFCDGDNDCGDNSDEANCAPITCSEGQTKCPNRNRCISTSYFCDGDNDCGDNSDEENCAPITCSEGQTKCPNKNECLPARFFCDGDNDCGDNSDEENCEIITCSGGRTQCPSNNKCIRSSYFCDGDNDCGDNSDEANCDGRGRGPTSDQSPPEMACIMELHERNTVCVQQLVTSLFGSMPSDPMQAFETLKKMDVEDVCRPILEWSDCMGSLDCGPVESDHFREMQQQFTIFTTMINYVCVEESDALQSNKQCLLRESTNSGMPDIAMGTMMSCGRLLQSLESQSSPCPPEELMQCVKGAVVEQCGDDAGSLLERLVNRYSQLSGCQKRTMKSLSVMKKKKRSGVLSFKDLMKRFL